MNHREHDPQLVTNSVDQEQGVLGQALDWAGNFLRHNKNKLTASATAAVLTFTLAGCGVNAQEGGPEPSTSTSAEPNPSTPPAEETEAPIDTPETGEFLGATVEQTLTIEQMDALQLPDFAKLGIGDRVAYAIDKVGAEAFPVIEDVSENDLINEAWSIPGYYWQSANAIAYNNVDPNVRAKLAGSYAYYTTNKLDGEITDSYQAAANDAVQYGGEGVGGNILMKYVDNGEPQEGVDRDGNPIYFANVTYKTGTNQTGITSPEKTSQAIRVPVKLLDGSTVIFYALGYSIDGHESPVEQYPY